MLKLDPVAITDVGRRRDHNEDYLGDFIITGEPAQYRGADFESRGYLFAVADGMGGHAAGEVASEMAVNILFDVYYNNPSSGNIAEDLARAVATANYQVHDAGLNGGKGQMGTTLTLSLFLGDRVLIGNVGDSRTYLIRAGKAVRLTKDHSLVQEQMDIGVLTEEQAEKSMMRNVITRAIGHRDQVEADFFEYELEPRDIILLCSDGLHGQISEPELGEIITAAPGLKAAAQQLINLANERGGPDNISVILVGVAEIGEARSFALNNMARATKTATMPMPVVEQATMRPQAVSSNGTTQLEKAINQNATTAPSINLKVSEKQVTKPLSNLTPKPIERSPIAPILVGLVLLVIAGAVAVLIFNPFSSNNLAVPITITPAVTAPAPTQSLGTTPTVAPVATAAIPTVGTIPTVASTPNAGGGAAQPAPTRNEERSTSTPVPTRTP